MGHFPWCEIPGGKVEDRIGHSTVKFIRSTQQSMITCFVELSFKNTFKFHHLQENKILRTLAEGVPSSANIWPKYWYPGEHQNMVPTGTFDHHPRIALSPHQRNKGGEI